MPSPICMGLCSSMCVGPHVRVAYIWGRVAVLVIYGWRGGGTLYPSNLDEGFGCAISIWVPGDHIPCIRSWVLGARNPHVYSRVSGVHILCFYSRLPGVHTSCIYSWGTIYCFPHLLFCTGLFCVLGWITFPGTLDSWILRGSEQDIF